MRANEKVRIFVVDHREKPESSFLPVIGVGANRTSEFQDHVGENIAEWNPYLNEATAIWWIWKHLDEVAPNAELIGICHYRRYWVWWLNRYALKIKPIIRMLEFPRFMGLRPWQALWLKKYHHCDGFYVDNPITCVNGFRGNIEQSYRSTLSYLMGSDVFFDECLADMEKAFPELVYEINKYLQRDTGHLYNMTLVSPAEYQKYCAFIFPLIFPYAQRIRNSELGRKPLARRSAGYLFECMSGVYWHCRTHQGLKMCKMHTRTFVKGEYTPSD